MEGKLKRAERTTCPGESSQKIVFLAMRNCYWQSTLWVPQRRQDDHTRYCAINEHSRLASDTA